MKSLLEFLNVLRNLTDANIKFLLNQKFNDVPGLPKYKSELESIQNLVNSFDFREKEHSSVEKEVFQERSRKRE